ncbi:hypothetical protein MPER_11486 [Moniliophthora perniciosa FA553]|nr:hypothetical protein MPER_11486 [Moniliophthora perniciosa FA553]
MQRHFKSATVNYPTNASGTVHPLIENWSTNNTDLKGVILSTYGASGTNEDESFLSVQLFYDGPTPPSGLFDGFLNVPGANVNLIGTTSFPAALGTLNGAFGALNPPRTIRNTVPITHYTAGVLDEMKAQLESIVTQTRDNNRSFISLVITTEPQMHIRIHTHRGGSFAQLDWNDSGSDEFFVNLVSQTQQAIQSRAIEVGQSTPNAILYNNYAPANTPLDLIYGDNLGRLREVKRRVDPENVMALAGGFKIDP